MPVKRRAKAKAKHPHVSEHRHPNGKTSQVPRAFKDGHLAARFHEIEWGEAAHPKHDLIGQHGPIVVTYVEDYELEHGYGGPEFLLTWPDGSAVSVIDAETARQYLRIAAGEPIDHVAGGENA